MKRLICSVLALGAVLWGCAAVPAETTGTGETTLPVQTTVPVETSHVETTAPASELPRFVTVTDPETELYAGPAARWGCVGLVGEYGTYTIVEEAADGDGNLWGRLKSGAGWLCLNDPMLAPIYADYAEETFNAYHAYWGEDSDYITAIGFTAAETLTDVRFGLLDWFETESYQMQKVLYTIDTMTADQPFLAQVTFWGDMTTYGISFTDADGQERCYAVSISGKDGSLLCTEYTSE